MCDNDSIKLKRKISMLSPVKTRFLQSRYVDRLTKITILGKILERRRIQFHLGRLTSRFINVKVTRFYSWTRASDAVLYLHVNMLLTREQKSMRRVLCCKNDVGMRAIEDESMKNRDCCKKKFWKDVFNNYV